MKKRYLFGIVGGVALLLGSFASRFDSFSFSVMFAAGLSMLLSSLIRYKKYGDGPEQDERTKKISYTALAASFQIALMAIILLWWINYFNPLKAAVGDLLGILMLGMIFLNIFFRFYYGKKEDLMI
jgi:uncharacterized membrane protein